MCKIYLEFFDSRTLAHYTLGNIKELKYNYASVKKIFRLCKKYNSLVKCKNLKINFFNSLIKICIRHSLSLSLYDFPNVKIFLCFPRINQIARKKKTMINNLLI